MQGYVLVVIMALLSAGVHAQINFPNIDIPSISITPAIPNYTQTACTLDCGWSTIDVNGATTLNVSPDIATLNLQMAGSGKTNNDALTILSQKITAVLNTLSSLGLSSANWQTTYLNVYANTSYVNGQQVTYGQIATQTMTVTVPMVGSDGKLVGQVYDGLAQINDVYINGLTFDLQDKTVALGQARKQAYQDAVRRATDYASAAGVTLGLPLTITDSYSVAPVAVPQSLRMVANTALLKSAVPTTVSVGIVPINYNLEVVFSFV